MDISQLSSSQMDVGVEAKEGEEEDRYHSEFYGKSYHRIALHNLAQPHTSHWTSRKFRMYIMEMTRCANSKQANSENAISLVSTI